MVEVKDATIFVGDRVIAEGLSFMAKDGRLTCITGDEGCGKTTLLRTLMGFLPVRTGYVSVDGELLTTASAHAFRALMVYLPQQMQLLAHQLYPPQAESMDAEAYCVWNSVLPEPVAATPPQALSPEEIFRLAEETFRQSGDKQIVIADEPAAYLTPELTERMLGLLRQQSAAGKTVLIASRRQMLVEHADSVIEL